MKSNIGNLFAKIANKNAKYPETVAEVLDEDIKYKSATIKALQNFKDSNPYSGSKKDMQDKLRKLNSELSKIYGMTEPVLSFNSGVPSCYMPFGHVIVLEPTSANKYSIIAFLHEFRHSMGYMNEQQACWWSINLFKKVFPEHYKKLRADGHMLYRK